MYITRARLAPREGFDEIQVGDAPAAVLAAMGKPQEECASGSLPHGRHGVSLLHLAWPRVWVVSLKDGKVLEKSKLPSR